MVCILQSGGTGLPQLPLQCSTPIHADCCLNLGCPVRISLICEDYEVVRSAIQYHPPTTSLTFRAKQSLHVFAIPLLSRIMQGLRWLREFKLLYTDHHLPCHHRHLGTLVVTGSGHQRHPDSVLTSSLPAGMPVHFTSGFSLSPVHCFFTNFHRHVSANSFGDSLARVEIN